MKGVMGFLAKAGFVTPVNDGTDRSPPGGGDEVPVVDPVSLPVSTEPVAPVEEQISLSLTDVYAAAGIPVSPYPAEKLLRVLDGLGAMDQGTQKVAIAAMDAADDGWTIDDPIRDAQYKVEALAAHVDRLRAGVEQAETETMEQIGVVKQNGETRVADIRKQIVDLEALMSREIARSVQEQADLTSSLTAKREGANRLIEQLLVTSTSFKLLISQFRQASAQPAGQGAPQTNAGI
jgi:hypothetical protein